MNPFHLSFLDRLRSRSNDLFFTLRKQIAFKRPGYAEKGWESAIANWEESLSSGSLNEVRGLEERAFFSPMRQALSLSSWRKNLATLWILERFPELRSSQTVRVLEAGAHDFQRAPALQAFFLANGVVPILRAIELDAYRVLQGFHSRYDRAQYFASLAGRADYWVGDFFSHTESVPAERLFAFYPFVSPHPALAWGLPAGFGTAEPWLVSIYRNLAPQGLALVLHQGSWEEEEFDAALARKPGLLLLRRREVLECPFYPTPYPMHASVYETQLKLE